MIKFQLYFRYRSSIVTALRYILMHRMKNSSYFRNELFRFVSIMPDVYEKIRDIVQKDSVLEQESFKPYDF
jgi:hypothetical protein